MEESHDDSASPETAHNKDAASSTPLKKPPSPQEQHQSPAEDTAPADDESKPNKADAAAVDAAVAAAAVASAVAAAAAASHQQEPNNAAGEEDDDNSKPHHAVITALSQPAHVVATTSSMPEASSSSTTTTTTTSRAEKIAELERQAGLLQKKWEDMFSRLQLFRSREGHCLVPNRYEKDPQLGAWVSTQRRQYKIMKDGAGEATPMTKTRAARLEAVGFKWSTSDPRHVPWEKRYAELVQFKEKYNHTQVPIGWEENIQLSNWVSTQRQEFKLLQKGRSSRLDQKRIMQLNKIDFVWEAQRGGPRRKRKATVAVPPNANPVEGLGSPNSRQRMGPGGTIFPPAMQYGMLPGFSMMGGAPELPLVNMGMPAAAMQTAAAAAVAATPPWAMMGFGAFQQGPGGGAPIPTMMFPMAQQQMPWAMAQMQGRFPGGPMPDMAVHPPHTTGETPATPNDAATATNTDTITPGTEGTTEGTKMDTATPNVSTTAETPLTVKAPPEAASTSPAKESTEPSPRNSEPYSPRNSPGSPSQTAGATISGSTTAVEDVQTEAEAAADADAGTGEEAATPTGTTEASIEAALAETGASTGTPSL